MRSNSTVLNQRIACVSIDLEEDHAGLVPNPALYEGLRIFPEIVTRLKALEVPLTVFVAGNFLEQQSSALDNLRDLEYHSHGYRHPDLKEAWDPEVRRQNMEKGLDAFEAFFKRSSLGYRAPYGILEPADYRYLQKRGIRFDSSVFPSIHVSGFRPWLRSDPQYHPDVRMVEFPISSLFGLRIPYSFAYMNLLGMSPYKFLSALGGIPNPLILNFHLHDFLRTSSTDRMSGFFKTVYGRRDFETSWKKFEDFIGYLKAKRFVFRGMDTTYRQFESAWKIP